MGTAPDRYHLQDSRYAFPYHYLAAVHPFSLHRELSWGLEYMTYLSFVAELVADYKPASVLDVGCGEGRLLQEISQHVDRADGVDPSEAAVGFAKAFNPRCDIWCDDVANLTGSYDLVTMVEVLEHIADDAVSDFVAAVAARLKPNGLLVLSVPTMNKPLNPKHHRHYSLESLTQSLDPHFDVRQHWWLYRRGIREGVIRRLLCNGLWTLNHRTACELLWRAHKRSGYFADPQTGAHLVLTAVKAS